MVQASRFDDALRITVRGRGTSLGVRPQTAAFVHRDIKPANILLTRYSPAAGGRGGWHALVADFGIARYS